jgi:hypothetical protein
MSLRVRRPARLVSFERLVEDAFGGLVAEHGFEGPFAESFPHAQERVTYRQGRAVVDVTLGDGRIGVGVDVTTPSGDRVQLGDERFQRRDEAWEDETRRLLGELADELERRAGELLGTLEELAAGACERLRFLESELGFGPARMSTQGRVLELTWKHGDARRAVSLFLTVHGIDGGWVGRLDAAGRRRPLDRDTIGHDWYDLRDLGVEPRPALSPAEQLDAYADALSDAGERLLDDWRFERG